MPRHLPQFLRLVARLRALDQPLIIVHGWPASGRSQVLAALADSVPVRYTDQRAAGQVPAAAVKEFLADAGRSSGCWFVIDGELSLASLGLAAELLSEDQRLIFTHSTDTRPPWLPLAELPAKDLLLTASEIEELWINLRDAPPAAGQIDQLLSATDGWYEPTKWLLEQSAPPSETLQGHPFREVLGAQIWDHLPVDRRDLLLEISLTDTLDQELWHKVWSGDGAKIEILRELSAEWGLASDRQDHLRLPALLELLLVTRRRSLWTVEEEHDLYRKLGEAVLKEGRKAEAVRYLSRSGNQERLVELIEMNSLELVSRAPLEWMEQALSSQDQGRPSQDQGRRLDWWRGLVAAARGASATQVEALLAQAANAKPDASRELLVMLALRAAGLEIPAASSTSSPTVLGALIERLVESRTGRQGRARTAVKTSRRYAIQLFGQTRITMREEGSGEVELSSPLRKAFQVIAFLALSPGMRAPKQELVEAVWPESDRETIRKNFHPTLSAARRTLQGQGIGEVILYQDGLYSLHPVYEWRVDVDRFRRRIEEGRQQLAEAGEHRGQALAIWLDSWRLYQGPFLEEYDAPWIHERRESLQRRYLNLLRDIGDLATRLERHEQALDAYRSVLFEDPFDEKVHVALMHLYAQQGRRDLVRRQYVRLQELLKELSVEPLSETQELYHQLMS